MKMQTGYEFFAARDPRSQEVANWVASKITGCERGWTGCAAMRVHRGGQIGGVVFHNWNPEAQVICMSAAGGDGWLTRPVLRAMHGYVFDDAGCQLAVLQVSENNTVMRRIARAYGYRETIVPRLRGRNEAEVIMTLAEEDWRASRFNGRSAHGQS